MVVTKSGTAGPAGRVGVWLFFSLVRLGGTFLVLPQRWRLRPQLPGGLNIQREAC
jgi:hypothetical protein